MPAPPSQDNAAASASAPVEPDAWLNEALEAFLHWSSTPSPPRLLAYLARVGKREEADAIEARLWAAVRDTDDYLYERAGRVEWSPAFQEALFQHVRQRSGWLSRPAFRHLVIHGQWFCHQEGLNAGSDGDG